jgi:LPXTG-site transpeptidase (sortase) family protein
MKLRKSISKKIFPLTNTVVVLFFFMLLINSENGITKIPRSHVFKNNLKPIIESITQGIQEENQTGLPVRIKIPRIGVDATILSLGLTETGAMDTPKNAEDVAWFNLGVQPGEIGSAVIAGHYGTWKNGSGSVFDNLNTLSKGDSISIEDENGAVISFKVRDIQKYDPAADATEIFSSDDEKAHLNLITCQGLWNKDAKSFSQRLVVFTDKE